MIDNNTFILRRSFYDNDWHGWSLSDRVGSHLSTDDIITKWNTRPQYGHFTYAFLLLRRTRTRASQQTTGYKNKYYTL